MKINESNAINICLFRENLTGSGDPEVGSIGNKF